MKWMDFAKRAMGERGMRKADLARALGMTSQGVEARLERSENPKLNNLVDVLEVVGYDVVAVPKGARLPKGACILERGEVLSNDRSKLTRGQRARAAESGAPGGDAS